MPIEIKELVIRASVDSQRENSTSNQSSISSANRKADRQLNELLKIKKIIEQKNER